MTHDDPKEQAFMLWLGKVCESPMVGGDTLRKAFYAGWESSKGGNGLPLGGGHNYTGEAMVLSHEERQAGVDRLVKRWLDDKILNIWQAWPLKKARGAALPAIKKALHKRPDLLKDVQEYAAAVALWPAEDKKFIPMCSTWMNQERWLDDRATWQRQPATPAPVSQFSRTH